MSDGGKTKTTVEIYGQSYTIIGQETKMHMRHVASIVDDKMREINEKNPYLDINKLAVLTAVNVVHDYLKLKEQYEKLEIQLKEKE
ncbi:MULTISPECIES: cell division protein ZapA [Bacillus]|uniref:Cell division protein ZapA n=4 Tax=Bacillus TaxID=1386 RepID=ZAPA_BACP2|nr:MULTISPECIES: cell division protein ZapA [Bacillus]A8FG14.1 RecName: Full=Cell division protein ZapA; AltName: Full=Z ring-associated protein ZapA [Bacillus pumilus SAFR-032]MBW4849379.1 cell division protein ZapA [Bacillaceae bacterium]MBY0190221.1 cell division protein ZapA [Bacillus aerophilus]PNU23926.1 cell division protein ZapA [Bacillus stratosphericus]UYO34771.1 cell division protein ZapA [Bacillus zhangzhouensis]ABV63181.1 cell division protein ZapA [Bacillus pumilus SAFR-032]